MSEESKFDEPKMENGPKKKSFSLNIPLIKVPNDSELLEEELKEIYDEDKVTHEHGDSEPEAD